MTPHARRKLTAVDDPLAADIDTPRRTPKASPTATSDRVALYAKLRVQESDALARAAFELRVHKRDLIGALIARHVDATTDDGRDALRALLADFQRECG